MDDSMPVSLVKDFDRPGRWAKADKMEFNKNKSKVNATTTRKR